MPTIRLETAAPSGVLVPVQGRDGQSIRIAGTVATWGALPSSGLTTGDLYVVTADGLGYVWSGTAFPASGQGIQIRGPQGDVGPIGSQGEASTVPGPPGPQGDVGPPGVSITSGTGAPAGSPAIGTLYVNSVTGDLWRYS